ncbi:hypothetical protein [Phyllobacterium sp. K27]
MTDALRDRDWNDALTWLDKLRERPDDEVLLQEFEAWLGAAPGRAGICRKLGDVERLAPMLGDLVNAGIVVDRKPGRTEEE